MVNENEGKVYEPVTFYNRKLLRSVLRHKVSEKYSGNTNKRMALAFKRLRGWVNG